MAVTDDEFDKLKDRVKDLEKSRKHVQHCIESACSALDTIVEHYNLSGEYMVADKCKTCMIHLKHHAYDNKL